MLVRLLTLPAACCRHPGRESNVLTLTFYPILAEQVMSSSRKGGSSPIKAASEFFAKSSKRPTVTPLDLQPARGPQQPVFHGGLNQGAFFDSPPTGSAKHSKVRLTHVSMILTLCSELRCTRVGGHMTCTLTST